MSVFKCRCCHYPVTEKFATLGHTPLANDYLSNEQAADPEIFYPLEAKVCSNCFLVQLDAFETPERIFSEYAYFSSYATSWVEHAKKYVIDIQEKLQLNKHSLVIEVASNDGYLLQHFQTIGIPILGIEPAENVASIAQRKGIPTEILFFGTETAERLCQQGKQADLVIGNNVLAHVPDLTDFVSGLALLVKPTGRITLEFPHLARLIQYNQFDTIYHEHFSYFSLLAIENLFNRYGLTLIDVEELPTHGGSLRIHMAKSTKDISMEAHERIEKVRQLEKTMHLDCLETYQHFQIQIDTTKYALLRFLLDIKAKNQTIAGYGAPAKGNTMLNTCGIHADLLPYTVDVSPHKQHRFLPGSHIPIYPVEKILETQPDFLWILPWNLKEEIVEKMSMIRNWGGKFVVAIPKLEIF